MGMREKLTVLIQSAVGGCATYWAGLIADHLIANGVTIQKWIPVTERLPESNDDGTGNAVLVTNGSVQHIAYLAKDIFHFTENGEMKERVFYEVTHWMPLPEPPSGERRPDDERTG